MELMEMEDWKPNYQKHLLWFELMEIKKSKNTTIRRNKYGWNEWNE